MASLHQHDEYKRRVDGGAGAADVPERPTSRYVLSPLPGRPTVERATGPFADFVEALDELERTVNRHLSLRLVLLLAVSVLLVLLLVTR